MIPARQWCDETQFALGRILSVAEQRKDDEIAAQCRALQHASVRTLTISNVRMTQKGKRKLFVQLDSEVLQVAERLQMVINLEMREAVWPLQEVKESTHKFGTAFVPSKYLTWLPEKSNRSPEELVVILKRQLDELEIALGMLRKHQRIRQKNKMTYTES